MCSHSLLPLSQLDVLVVDCQATAAAPRGHLLEIGWARAHATSTEAHARLIALPDGERIPSAVARITGISDCMMRAAVDAHVGWQELTDDAARFTLQPAPTVIHFARFEQPFLQRFAGGVPPLDIVCTHDIARRLLPDLPRRGLRALAGYFGRAVGALRRSADHVEATAFVWRELVKLLGVEGISTWTSLHEWLATPVASMKRSRRVWPMPRELRLSLPDSPGVYRLLRTSGDVLYVGKASSLHDRVNSYFHNKGGVPERLLEMLSQVRAISFELAPTPLEAALLEPDEIKQHRPPYNVALTANDRAVWFASRDFSARSPRRSKHCPLGPFLSAETLDQFGALAGAHHGALVSGRWGPDVATFSAGYRSLRAAHPEFSGNDLTEHARLLRLGTRLWREGRRDRDLDDDDAAQMTRRITEWTPELVQFSLERLALRTALARRRALWLTRLVDATLVWIEPGIEAPRLIVIEKGEIVVRAAIDVGVAPPVPAGHKRSIAERCDLLTIPCFDRLRVLTTELKRVVAAGAPAALRLGAAPALTDARLASALSWV